MKIIIINDYLNKIWCIINSLMWVFLQSDCVKQKKYALMLKQEGNFSWTNANAPTIIKHIMHYKND